MFYPKKKCVRTILPESSSRVFVQIYLVFQYSPILTYKVKMTFVHASIGNKSLMETVTNFSLSDTPLATDDYIL